MLFLSSLRLRSVIIASLILVAVFAFAFPSQASTLIILEVVFIVVAHRIRAAYALGKSVPVPGMRKETDAANPPADGKYADITKIPVSNWTQQEVVRQLKIVEDVYADKPDEDGERRDDDRRRN